MRHDCNVCNGSKVNLLSTAAITPNNLPIKDIITSTETACYALKNPATAQSLCAEIVKAIKQAKPPKLNITSTEFRAIESLRKDDTISILPADKGRATEVLDKTEYVSKMNDFLKDTNTYEPLKKDPTQKYQARMKCLECGNDN